MVKIALTNIKKWRSEPTVWLVFAVLFLYVIYFIGPFSAFASEVGERVPMWIVAGFFTHGKMPIVYVALMGLMFCNAPYYDASSQFYLVRVGRFKWIMGQFLYVVLTAIILVMAIWFMSWIVLLPVISFENDWGRVIRSAVLNGTLSAEHPLRLFFPSNIEAFPAVRTALLSFIVVWLTTVFSGTLFMFLNTVSGKVLSFSVFGFLWFLCMIPDLTIMVQWGAPVFRINFFRFVDLFSARDYSGLSYTPPIMWCYGALLLGIVIFFTVTVIVFCRRDLDAGREE